jgi:uncharacterized membrane protein YhaH (DUF805 family)
MLQSIAMTFSKYFEFKGRATRKEYWTFTIFFTVILFVLQLTENLSTFVGVGIFNGIAGLVSLITFIPNFTCAVRRIRDTGKSVWFVLFPIINFILLFFPSAPEETHED